VGGFGGPKKKRKTIGVERVKSEGDRRGHKTVVAIKKVSEGIPERESLAKVGTLRKKKQKETRAGKKRGACRRRLGVTRLWKRRVRGGNEETGPLP